MSSTRLAPWFAAGLLVAVALAGCGSKSNELLTSCDGVAIDPYKELVIVEPRVIDGPISRDASNGVASYRHVADVLEPATHGESLGTSLVVAYETLAPERKDAFERDVVCPWLQREPKNACDATCGVCAARTLAPSVSPFRLIAIATRTDLGAAPDAASPGGEGRLVLAVTKGLADDAASPELPFTVNVEMQMDGTAAAWTRDLHALSAFDDQGEAYASALAALVSKWVHLAQIRINDAAFGPQMFLELTVADGRAAARGLRNTPSADVDEATLATVVAANASLIRDDQFVLSPELRAPKIIGPHTWPLSGVDSLTQQSFIAHTCNGCHGGAQPSLDGFHIAPGKVGAARVSSFLTDAELRRRATLVQSTLCAK